MAGIARPTGFAHIRKLTTRRSAALPTRQQPAKNTRYLRSRDPRTAVLPTDMTMADIKFTTNPRVSTAEFLHASERAHPDGKPDGEEERDLVSVIEEALEEERTRLMLANSMLGCVQIALDPEAISVAPAVYFPEVLELARQLINTSVQRLEYEEIRRLLHRSMSCSN
jgi:hypothetical protein